MPHSANPPDLFLNIEEIRAQRRDHRLHQHYPVPSSRSDHFLHFSSIRSQRLLAHDVFAVLHASNRQVSMGFIRSPDVYGIDVRVRCHCVHVCERPWNIMPCRKVCGLVFAPGAYRSCLETRLQDSSFQHPVGDPPCPDQPESYLSHIDEHFNCAKLIIFFLDAAWPGTPGMADVMFREYIKVNHS